MRTDTMLETRLRFFLLANISHETLPCREVQSRCDEFRATDVCPGTQISLSCCSFYRLRGILRSAVLPGKPHFPFLRWLQSHPIQIPHSLNTGPFSAFLSSFPIHSVFHSTGSSCAIVKVYIGRRYNFLWGLYKAFICCTKSQSGDLFIFSFWGCEEKSAYLCCPKGDCVRFLHPLRVAGIQKLQHVVVMGRYIVCKCLHTQTDWVFGRYIICLASRYNKINNRQGSKLYFLWAKLKLIHSPDKFLGM